MKKIDWKKLADEYKLTPQEFGRQILITGCVTADMMLDNDKDSTMKFTCNQPGYNLEMTVRRVER